MNMTKQAAQRCFCLAVVHPRETVAFADRAANGDDEIVVRIVKSQSDATDRKSFILRGSEIPERVQQAVLQSERDQYGTVLLSCDECKHRLVCLIDPAANASFEPR